MVTAVANVTMRESKARSTMQKRAHFTVNFEVAAFSISRNNSNNQK